MAVPLVSPKIDLPIQRAAREALDTPLWTTHADPGTIGRFSTAAYSSDIQMTFAGLFGGAVNNEKNMQPHEITSEQLQP